MKHSVRYQENVYDQSTDEIVKPAREILRTTIATNVFGDDLDNKEGSGEEFELTPKQGDIVALLDPILKVSNMNSFKQKLLDTVSINPKYIYSFGAFRTRAKYVCLKPGRVWTESIKSLIFPLDVVCNQNIKAYELRTLPE